jgi:putative transposase
MVHYRRNRVAGGTFFFTVTLADRRSRLLTDEIELLRGAVRSVKRRKPFHIDAMVVLHDHLHALWTLPPGDDDYPGRWRAIKSAFVRALRAAGYPLVANKNGEYGVWQRRYWEHTVRDDADFARHVDYIHWNPVKHGVAACVADWPHSSFHRHVHAGLLPPDWAGGPEAGEWGE